MSRRPCIHPAKRLRLRASPKDYIRFLAKVRLEDRGFSSLCWIWTAASDDKGYGRFKIGGKPEWAHRVSCAMFRLTIADTHEVDHKCKQPDCVCPWHLKARPVAENRRDINRGLYKRKPVVTKDNVDGVPY